MFRKSRNLEGLCGCMDRRYLMCAAALTALLAAIGSGVRPARAPALCGAQTRVDRLAVRVLVNSYQFAVAPSRKAGNVEIVHFGWGIGRSAGQDADQRIRPRHACPVEARRANPQCPRRFRLYAASADQQRLLVGLDPAILDALVLSHGHYDHFGGMAGFLEQYGAALKPNLPLYVGGEEAFCSRIWTGPPVKGDFGAIDRSALKSANIAVTNSRRRRSSPTTLSPPATFHPRALKKCCRQAQ